MDAHVPTVYADTIVNYPTEKNRYKIWVACPFCGKTHDHGTLNIKELGTDRRASDCRGNEYIIDVDDFTVWKRKTKNGAIRKIARPS